MKLRHRTAALLATALTAVLLTGCGVRPTGVLDGGKSAGGLTTGHRLYFVSPTGRLEAVARPGTRNESIEDPNGVLKGLRVGPTQSEREVAGLTTLMGDDDGARYVAKVSDGLVYVSVSHHSLSLTTVDDRNLLGQIVCSIARSRAVLGGGKQRTEEIPVVVQTGDGRSKKYGCAEFME
ncbi:GerMN domain-containing protein [Streptomyces qinzhouensis]|uniref:GerMN domain-containing protein n=1 Tax=Streptomyces qinzhouensis TaxID=2599401 RepID=A0A5B8J6C3_9ACTN|nr:GerMN domain-containing protein [Streptomyces qinzhouensis]QDY75581.1 GerMN domain-containing protein [Streptomyces qinzhouensis]